MLTFQTFPEFAAFLMAHVAMADGQLHHLEEATVAEKLQHFGNDYRQWMDTAVDQARSTDTSKMTEILTENYQRLQPVAEHDREHLIRSLYAIVNADGRVQEEESQMMKRLREILFVLTA